MRHPSHEELLVDDHPLYEEAISLFEMGSTETVGREEQKPKHQTDDESATTLRLAKESMLRRLYGAMGGRGSILSGIKSLDNVTGGFQASELTVVTSHPGGGKTALLGQFMMEAAESGKKSLMFSLEMKKAQITERMIISKGRFDASYLRRCGHALNPREQEAISHGIRRGFNAMRNIMAGISIYDHGRVSMESLRRSAKEHQEKCGLDVIFIDCIELIQKEANPKTYDSCSEVARVSIGLKSLARELKVPVVASAQLCPVLTQRDAAVMMAADVVIALDREPDENNLSGGRGRGTLTLLKHKHGARGVFKIQCISKYFEFKSMEKEALAYTLPVIYHPMPSTPQAPHGML